MIDSKLPGSRISELPDDDIDALEQESVRQEMDDFQESLQGREKGLRALQEAQQILEDQLEDANTEIDRLQRELDRAIVERDESEYLRKEADGARKQLEASLYNIQSGVEEAKVTDLRDERMHRSRRAIDISIVTYGPFVKGALVGLALGAGAAWLVMKFTS